MWSFLSYLGVSCDSCMRNNFRGKRYKCLVCYDYDLCENCHDSNVFSANRPANEPGRSQHSSDHPMQCILTQLAYGWLAILFKLCSVNLGIN